MKVTIVAAAFGHLDEGFEWYERQEQGAGEYFLRTILAEIAALSDLAGIHRKFRGLYRMGSRVFPFAIYYSLKEDEVLVRAVLDSRRSPAWIRKQLGR